MNRRFLLYRILFILIMALLLIPFGCDDGAVEETYLKSELDEISVSYGNSFGECIGYCITTMTFDQEKMTLLKSGWTDDVETKIYTQSIRPSLWDSISSIIDIEAFLLQNDTIIGCPDCADGGLEWVEIRSNSYSRKVTFEYGNAPNFLKEYVPVLRRQEHCFVDN